MGGILTEINNISLNHSSLLLAIDYDIYEYSYTEISVYTVYCTSKKKHTPPFNIRLIY